MLSRLSRIECSVLSRLKTKAPPGLPSLQPRQCAAAVSQKLKELASPSRPPLRGACPLRRCLSSPLADQGAVVALPGSAGHGGPPFPSGSWHAGSSACNGKQQGMCLCCKLDFAGDHRAIQRALTSCVLTCALLQYAAQPLAATFRQWSCAIRYLRLQALHLTPRRG